MLINEISTTPAHSFSKLFPIFALKKKQHTLPINGVCCFYVKKEIMPIHNRFHATYTAYELTRSVQTDSVEKFTKTLLDAQIELTPHQVEAALFAFRTPLSKGAILADEVGLGKTIEAGLVIAQKWAERKRKILIIVPANLRKQWSQELQDKFFLPSIIFEKKSFDAGRKTRRVLNPFLQETPTIVICSYHFAKAKDLEINQIDWDLVVLDEAHKLRNVYKPSNRIANAIKLAIWDKPKILLTATPLQNSLMELYGLVSIIDEHIFGDVKAFREQFTRIEGADAPNFSALRSRIKPICNRTLRRQVTQYVRYTSRRAVTQEFTPYDAEVDLYNNVSDYLRRPRLYALPNSQRQLMTMILRRLMASSTFAISGTFLGMANKLKYVIEQQLKIQQETAQEQTALPEDFMSAIAENFESYENDHDEWASESEEDDEQDLLAENRFFTAQEVAEMQEEYELLHSFYELAHKIDKNSKGDHLVTALDKGFAALKEVQAPQKAIIFTESKRTQEYITEILDKTKEYKGKYVLFNGTNNDLLSRRIYKNWLEQHKGTDKITGSASADKRAALVEYFRDEATIMIATEAGAEGINLQFCALVVNYDLPWNPQRIEQRIGRAHRYGQKFDVVVVNFLNLANAADQRVYNLLSEKFKLFDGIFGASDEVLGAIESGVDFEKRINAIYNNYRSDKEIKAAFDDLQAELEDTISVQMNDTKQKLLENFDAEVHEKLRINFDDSLKYLDRYSSMLWDLTKYKLADVAHFQSKERIFSLEKNPFPQLSLNVGPYQLLSPKPGDTEDENNNLYRMGHPLAKEIIAQCKTESPLAASVEFVYEAKPRMAAIEFFVGNEGYLQLCNYTISSEAEEENHLLFAAFTQDGEVMPQETATYLISLPMTFQSIDTQEVEQLKEEFETILTRSKTDIAAANSSRYAKYLDDEMDKLEYWAEDRKNSLDRNIHNLDVHIKQQKAEARRINNLEAKIALQHNIKKDEMELSQLRQQLYTTQDDISNQKEELLDKVQIKLKAMAKSEIIFTLQWKLK